MSEYLPSLLSLLYREQLFKYWVTGGHILRQSGVPKIKQNKQKAKDIKAYFYLLMFFICLANSNLIFWRKWLTRTGIRMSVWKMSQRQETEQCTNTPEISEKNEGHWGLMECSKSHLSLSILLHSVRCTWLNMGQYNLLLLFFLLVCK